MCIRGAATELGQNKKKGAWLKSQRPLASRLGGPQHRRYGVPLPLPSPLEGEGRVWIGVGLELGHNRYVAPVLVIVVADITSTLP